MKDTKLVRTISKSPKKELFIAYIWLFTAWSWVFSTPNYSWGKMNLSLDPSNKRKLTTLMFTISSARTSYCTSYKYFMSYFSCSSRVNFSREFLTRYLPLFSSSKYLSQFVVWDSFGVISIESWWTKKRYKMVGSYMTPDLTK